MRTRRLAVTMTAAILGLPLLPAAAGASSPEHKCEQATGIEHKCEKTRD